MRPDRRQAANSFVMSIWREAAVPDRAADHPDCKPRRAPLTALPTPHGLLPEPCGCGRHGGTERGQRPPMAREKNALQTSVAPATEARETVIKVRAPARAAFD